ncbi:hypothetical protein ACRALDRAFT_210969, partial [Sodiomyces alcalophilus JCM 7366]|uniref:uncharacterized protein n=1 Tax=Sodiomyces alcalophilus JCM 7366 TaxID=591952 RepID=UPI0039B47ECA
MNGQPYDDSDDLSLGMIMELSPLAQPATESDHFKSVHTRGNKPLFMEHAVIGQAVGTSPRTRHFSSRSGHDTTTLQRHTRSPTSQYNVQADTEITSTYPSYRPGHDIGMVAWIELNFPIPNYKRSGGHYERDFEKEFAVLVGPVPSKLWKSKSASFEVANATCICTYDLIGSIDVGCRCYVVDGPRRWFPDSAAIKYFTLALVKICFAAIIKLYQITRLKSLAKVRVDSIFQPPHLEYNGTMVPFDATRRHFVRPSPPSPI